MRAAMCMCYVCPANDEGIAHIYHDGLLLLADGRAAVRRM